MAEIDRLWSTYPRGHPIYTRVGADMPLRSLKTVLLNLCKEPGLKVFVVNVIKDLRIQEVLSSAVFLSLCRSIELFHYEHWGEYSLFLC